MAEQGKRVCRKELSKPNSMMDGGHQSLNEVSTNSVHQEYLYCRHLLVWTVCALVHHDVDD